MTSASWDGAADAGSETNGHDWKRYKRLDLDPTVYEIGPLGPFDIDRQIEIQG